MARTLHWCVSSPVVSPRERRPAVPRSQAVRAQTHRQSKSHGTECSPVVSPMADEQRRAQPTAAIPTYPTGYLGSGRGGFGSGKGALGGGLRAAGGLAGSGGRGGGGPVLAEEPGLLGTVLVPALCVGIAAGVMATRAYYNNRGGK